MWAHLRLLWVRRPTYLQRVWADECLCLWASLRMIVGRYTYPIPIARRRRDGALRSWRPRRGHELLDPYRLFSNDPIPCLKSALDGLGTPLVHGHGQQVVIFIQGKMPAVPVVRDMIPAHRRGICSSRFGRGRHGRRHIACVRQPVCDNAMQSWL
jgi:hypothetical protein